MNGLSKLRGVNWFSNYFGKILFLKVLSKVI